MVWITSKPVAGIRISTSRSATTAPSMIARAEGVGLPAGGSEVRGNTHSERVWCAEQSTPRPATIFPAWRLLAAGNVRRFDDRDSVEGACAGFFLRPVMTVHLVPLVASPDRALPASVLPVPSTSPSGQQSPLPPLRVHRSGRADRRSQRASVRRPRPVRLPSSA